MIIKRIYFPDDSYNINKIEFKKLFARYGQLWTKSSIEKYSCNGNEIIYDVYNTNDRASKILCIYEGDVQPVTLFYKTIGSGGNFLIDLNSFCVSIGCIIDNKKEEYLNNILLKLQDKQYINISDELKKEKDIEKFKSKDRKFRNNDDSEEIEINTLDLKERSIVENIIKRYIIDNKECLGRRGISIEIALLFKKKEIQDNVRWGLENGWI